MDMVRKRRLKLGHVRNSPASPARDNLLAAALRILEQGGKVTIAAAAKESGISTGTAYRYFPDSSTLLIKAIQEQQIALRGNIFEDLRSRFARTGNIEHRILLVHQVTFDLARTHECASRLFLAERLVSRPGTKDGMLDLRNLRRMRMYEMALEPLESSIGRKAVADLVSALSAASGMESYTVLKDMCGLDGEEIDRITRSNLLAILRATLSPCHEAGNAGRAPVDLLKQE